MSVAINKDTVVSLSYELRDAQGVVLEKADRPLTYLHGGYHGIFPRVEEELEGKEVGHECNLHLAPEDAFGEYDEALIRVEAKSMFPDNVAIGMQFQGTSQDSGQTLVYTVTDVAEDRVVVDANHPLAGKTVQFACTVTEVRKATPEEVSHGHAHGPEGHHHH
ncbi:MAG: peptidylprolyl isomerase [Betaproteobacteria bacterium]|nr:peptidylprolyl isomerase [Betaproteobacteria bacterium]